MGDLGAPKHHCGEILVDQDANGMIRITLENKIIPLPRTRARRAAGTR